MNAAMPAPALQDPPVPRRANTVIKMSPEAARKHTIQTIVAAVCCFVPAFFLWRNDHLVWTFIVGALGMLIFLSAFGEKSLVAPCPFCDAAIRGIQSGPRQEVRCQRCYEYSVVEDDKVKPMDPNTSNDIPRFLAPVFDGAVWPPACVACGAPPARFDTIEDRTVNKVGLVLGRVIVNRGSLSNVPYCHVHKDNVKLIVRQGNAMDLQWCSLRMMRLYLALNKGKRSLGTARSRNA
jgi:hypothetical protein